MTDSKLNEPASPEYSANEAPPQSRLNSWLVLLRGQAVLITVAVLAVLFGIVTLLVLQADLQPTWWDIVVTREIQQFPDWIGSVLVWVSAPGFQPWNWLIPIVVILGMLLLRWFTTAMFTLIADLGGFAAEIVKYSVHRPRPTPEYASIIDVLYTYSFPSGHVTGYVTTFGFLFYLAYTLLPRSNPFRRVVLVICALMIALVGPSRVYMGQHWTSDALAGYFLGFAWLLLIIQLHRAWLRRATKPLPE